MSESQTVLNFNLKFANINFPRIRKRGRMEKFGHFQWTETYSSSTKRYFQGNSEAHLTEIIKKWRIGFQDDENLSLLLIFDSNI